MEGSGENWPSDSELGLGDYVKDLGFDDDDEGNSYWETVDPMMGEIETDRKVVTERFLALSATIPGFRKMENKSCILDRASNYVKQLQERVRKLEQEMLLEVKVRILQKDIRIIIHCEKQKGIMLKILSHLENIHLSVVNSSLLPFGKSILDITVIAQMGDGYNMTEDELVKTLRVAILTQ